MGRWSWRRDLCNSLVLLRDLLEAPGLDPALKRTQLSIFERAWILPLQGLEESLRLPIRPQAQLLYCFWPYLLEGILVRAPPPFDLLSRFLRPSVSPSLLGQW
jgi:hypothetical protein